MSLPKIFPPLSSEMSAHKGTQFLFWFSLCLGVAAFVLIWAQLVFSSRIAMDDFCYVSQMNQYGLWDSLVHSRNIWWSRWASQIIIDLWTTFHLPTGSAVAYNASAFAFFWAALWFMTARVARRGSWELAWWQCATLALAGMAMLYALAPVRSEVWFWISGSSVYLLALALAFVIAASLLGERVRPLESVLAALCAWVLTGMSEATWLIVLVIWGWALWWSARYERRNLAARAWPFAVLLVGAAIALSAPGNSSRALADSNPNATWETLVFLLVYTYIALLMFNPWVWVVAVATGAALRILLPGTTPHARRWWVPLLFFWLSIVVQAPAVWGFKAPTPERSWLPAEVLLLLGLGALGWMMAPRGQSPRNAVLVTSALVWALFLPFFWEQQRVGVPAAQLAAAAYDRDYTLMLNQKAAGRRAPLVLNPLPRAREVFLRGPLPHNQYGVNDCLRQSLNLPFDVRLAEKK